jgi:hypothetical protein
MEGLLKIILKKYFDPKHTIIILQQEKNKQFLLTTLTHSGKHFIWYSLSPHVQTDLTALRVHTINSKCLIQQMERHSTEIFILGTVQEEDAKYMD